MGTSVMHDVGRGACQAALRLDYPTYRDASNSARYTNVYAGQIKYIRYENTLMMHSTMELRAGVTLCFQTVEPQNDFFGYYDKCPLDVSERRLLVHQIDFEGQLSTAQWQGLL